MMKNAKREAPICSAGPKDPAIILDIMLSPTLGIDSAPSDPTTIYRKADPKEEE